MYNTYNRNYRVISVENYLKKFPGKIIQWTFYIETLLVPVFVECKCEVEENNIFFVCGVGGSYAAYYGRV